MGRVYKARDPMIERAVAIKTLGVELEDEQFAEFKARFFREARSAGRVNHPNVVTVFDVLERAPYAARNRRLRSLPLALRGSGSARSVKKSGTL